MEDIPWLRMAIEKAVKESCASATSRNSSNWLTVEAFVPEAFWTSVVSSFAAPRQQPATSCKTSALGNSVEVQKWKLRACDLHTLLGKWERALATKTVGDTTWTERIGAVLDCKAGDITASWSPNSLRLVIRWRLQMFTPEGRMVNS